MRELILMLALVGCSSKADNAGERHDAAVPDATGLSFPLHGAISDPLVAHAGVRVVVGAARLADASSAIQCGKLVVKTDLANQTLPSQYQLTIPTGDYLLVAILLPAGTRAPVGISPITVDGEGVHYKSPDPTSTVDLTIQGTMPYDCP